MELAIKAKAQQLVLNLYTGKDQLKEVKNALKAYKIASEKMTDLKKARKTLNKQISEEKERIESEFHKDKTYTKLREEKLDAEEKIAIAKQEIKSVLKESAKKNESINFEVDVSGTTVRLQAQMSLDLFLNGKQE